MGNGLHRHDGSIPFIHHQGEGQGSEAWNCSAGTLSSSSLKNAAEKLSGAKGDSLVTGQGRNQLGSVDILLGPECLVFSTS